MTSRVQQVRRRSLLAPLAVVSRAAGVSCPRSPRPGRASRRPRPRRAASRAALPRRSRSAGKSTRPRVEVLHEHAEPLELARRTARPRAPRAAICSSSSRGLLRVDVAAVAGDAGGRAARGARPRRASPGGARRAPRRAAGPPRAARSPPRGEVAPGHPDIIARRVRRSTRSLPKRTARREMRLPRAGNPALEIFLWSRAGDLGRGAVLALRLRAEPPPARGGLGRPDADARPRRGHGRLGALGQRLVPAHRRARLRLGQGAAAAFYPLYPAAVGAARARALRPLRARRDPRLARRLARRRSCCCTGSPRSGSAPTARGGRCSTWPSSRSRSSCRPSTASRSTSC